jgi:hypothetical protein
MIGDTAMISDVIIMPDGRITLDWDGDIEVDDNGIFLMRKMLLDKMPKVVRDKSQRSSQIFSLRSCSSSSC